MRASEDVVKQVRIISAIMSLWILLAMIPRIAYAMAKLQRRPILNTRAT